MRTLLLFTLIFTSLLSYSFDKIELVESSNVRNTKNFYGQKNVLGNLPVGSQVEVISKSNLPSGAEAYEIKIITPENLTSLNNKAPLFIWISPYNEPKTITQTEANTICDGDFCMTEVDSSSLADLKKVTQQIEQQDSQITSVDEKSSPVEFDSSIEKYSQSNQVSTTVQFIEKNYNRKKSRLKCYRAVKEALANQTKSGKGPGKNLIPKWYGAKKAKNAVNNLKEFGFINLLDQQKYKTILSDPRNAPKGAVLVYSTKHHRWGHIEIKMDHGPQSRYGFDMINDKPITESRKGKYYTLIGVLIKPIEDTK